MKIYIHGNLMEEDGHDGTTGSYVFDLISASSWDYKFVDEIDEVH